MFCEARILDDEYPFEGVMFHSTTACGKPSVKRLSLEEGTFASCNDCFRRYNTQKDWYGWLDCSYPPAAKVVGSQAFYACTAKPMTMSKLPVQKKPIDGCATCWRVGLEKTCCSKCAVELCNACCCKGHSAAFCKKCKPVPKSYEQMNAEKAVKAIKADETNPISVDSLAEEFSKKVNINELDYPIINDISGLSIHELRKTKADLVEWMNIYAVKYPKKMVPFYKYRMKLEAKIQEKK